MPNDTLSYTGICDHEYISYFLQNVSSFPSLRKHMTSDSGGCHKRTPI